MLGGVASGWYVVELYRRRALNRCRSSACGVARNWHAVGRSEALEVSWLRGDARYQRVSVFELTPFQKLAPWLGAAFMTLAALGSAHGQEVVVSLYYYKA